MNIVCLCVTVWLMVDPGVSNTFDAMANAIATALA
jgi:hypothetical protein